MFYIEDGRSHFWQWDTDCRLVVENPSIKEVHFCNRTDSCSLVCEVYFHDDDFGGLYVVNVPNIILQDNLRFRAYAYDGNKTLHEEYFEVIKRSKPADYVYTETEVKRWEDVEAKVAELEEKVENIKIDEVPEHTHYVAGEPTDKTEPLPIIMIPNKQSTTHMVSYGMDTVDVGEAATITLFINEFMDIQVDSKASNGIESIIADGNKWVYGASNPSGIFYDEVNEKIEIKFYGAGSVKFTKFHKKATAEVGFIDAESMEFIKNHNLLSGEGEKSITQVKDTDYWTSTNEQVIDFIQNDKVGANNGAMINGAKATNNVFVGAFGKLSTMLGGKSQAMGGKSHAEGSKTIALENNSHAEGNETFAAGAHSHAEGMYSSAIGAQSHAEGLLNVAQGDNSHAEGFDNEATGYGAHVEGGRNTANFAYAHVGGFGNKAGADYQTVIGIANKASDDKAFIIGNGKINDDYSVNDRLRKNVFTVDWNGNVAVEGDISFKRKQNNLTLSRNMADLNQFKLLKDITLTQDVYNITFTANGVGANPLATYDDLFIYFIGNFTKNDNTALAVRINESNYLMWRGMTRAIDTNYGFWHLTEKIASDNDLYIYKSTYPGSLLANYPNPPFTQGLAANNQQVYSDIAAVENTSKKPAAINKLELFIPNTTENQIAAGSRCMLFGRYR